MLAEDQRKTGIFTVSKLNFWKKSHFQFYIELQIILNQFWIHQQAWRKQTSKLPIQHGIDKFSTGRLWHRFDHFSHESVHREDYNRGSPTLILDARRCPHHHWFESNVRETTISRNNDTFGMESLRSATIKNRTFYLPGNMKTVLEIVHQKSRLEFINSSMQHII